jgi:hypothetical protein
VSFVGGHHITFEANEIYETGNNALRMNSGNTDTSVSAFTNPTQLDFWPPPASILIGEASAESLVEISRRDEPQRRM